MSRPAFRFLVDVILFFSFLCLLWTAALVQFIFPPATTADGWRLWGVPYDTWSRISFGCLAVFTLCVLVHLILQWTWVCNFVATRLARRRGGQGPLPDGIKTLYGVATLITVLTAMGLLLAVAAVMARGPKR